MIYINNMRCNVVKRQPVHLHSLVRIFTARILGSQGCKVSSYGQRRLIRLLECADWFKFPCSAHSKRYIFSRLAEGTQESSQLWNKASKHLSKVEWYDKTSQNSPSKLRDKFNRITILKRSTVKLFLLGLNLVLWTLNISLYDNSNPRNKSFVTFAYKNTITKTNLAFVVEKPEFNISKLVYCKGLHNLQH